MKWIVGSGVHGYWLGSYEAEKQRMLSRWVRPGDVVLDIGANVGFYDLILSRLVGEKGRVIAFEPVPRNLNFLNRHVELNGLKNVEVRGVAIAKRCGKAKFEAGNSPAEGKIAASGDLEVEVVTLDSLGLGMLGNAVSLVKIDVEGAESEVLEGGQDFFKKYKPIILLATHGFQQVYKCKEQLEVYGYSVNPLDRNDPPQDCSEWLAVPRAV